MNKMEITLEAAKATSERLKAYTNKCNEEHGHNIGRLANMIVNLKKKNESMIFKLDMMGMPEEARDMILDFTSEAFASLIAYLVFELNINSDTLRNACIELEKIIDDDSAALMQQLKQPEIVVPEGTTIN